MSLGNTEWHAIRPWNPPIQLVIREITSVSVAFLLSSNVSLDPTASEAIKLSSDDSDEESSISDHDDDDSDALANKPIASALSRGLSVTVNGANWDRVLIKVDDKTDEAVVIIYNLMPGRQYDVDLGLVHGDEFRLRESIVTDDTDIEGQGSDSSITFVPSASSSPERDRSSMSSNHNATGSPSRPLLTLDDHIAHLQHALSVVNAERDNITSSIKTSRKDSQKADASLRSEIDKLKSLSEKHVSTEHRARQKTLALQEAVKRAQGATTDIDEEVKEIERILPDLRKERDEKEEEHTKVRESHDKVRTEKERVDKENAKVVESLSSELNTLTHKCERLTAKKEKLENVTIKDFEEQLREVELQIERAEREGMIISSMWAGATSSPVEDDPATLDQAAFSSRHRYSSSQPLVARHAPNSPTAVPGAIGTRPAPIQRPRDSPPQGAPTRSGSLPTPPNRPPLHSQRSSEPDANYSPSLSSNASSTSSLAKPPSTLSSAAAPFQPGSGKSIISNLKARGAQQQPPLHPRRHSSGEEGEEKGRQHHPHHQNHQKPPKVPAEKKTITILQNPARAHRERQNGSG